MGSEGAVPYARAGGRRTARCTAPCTAVGMGSEGAGTEGSGWGRKVSDFMRDGRAVFDEHALDVSRARVRREARDLDVRRVNQPTRQKGLQGSAPALSLYLSLSL
eukprot:2423481-Rhodomonas_salina.1